MDTQQKRAAPPEEGGETDAKYARKIKRVAREHPFVDEDDSEPSIELFHSRGWVVLPAFLTSEELAFLRNESEQLFQALDDDPARATQKIVDQSCVLDTMAECPMEDGAPARVDQHAYLVARAQQVHRLCARSASSVSSSDEVSVLSRLLFERLSRKAQRLLKAPDVFFFNEHYVVKPPRSSVEFRWHRDDDEQLAMCVHRAAIAPYVSAWCALDDVTADNGPLRFVPLDADPSSMHHEDEDPDPETLDPLATEPLIVEAGTVVLFLSNVWHCSSRNDSSATRRAFYAQFSREPITAASHDGLPLSFAIPCRSGQ